MADAGACTVAVAYSGGRDSTALLHATLAAARPLGIAVLALHVHHGLSANADAWLAHCADRCSRWARRGERVAFAFQRLDTSPPPGQSVEAWARRERYRALRRMALEGRAGLVLLAHHRRDQAETFLLQALRGSGVAGLASMPASAVREGIVWARPWLAAPSEAIAAYARRHRLKGVADESNADPRFARSRLRRDVWPALVAAFADAESTLSTAAGWAAGAAAAIDEQAATDCAAVATAGGLDIAAWRALSSPRRSHALRAWLREVTGVAAPATLIERLGRELDVAAARRWPLPAGELHGYRGRLAWRPATEAPSPQSPQCVDLSRAGVHELPRWGGAFVVERVTSGGIALAEAARLELRQRQAGDRFQAASSRPRRSLKLQYQAAGVRAAERLGPIVWHRDWIVFVPGLGLDARALATPGEDRLSLAWRPATAG
ncbi:MAG: tRNA lysidine(34) synthetase TilS [Caldimonas sp.]